MGESAYLEFDIVAICQLKEDYEKTIEFIKDELPDVNWNSPLEAKEYFKDEYDYDLVSIKIVDLLFSHDELISNNDYEPLIHDIQGLIELKKLQYTLRNYINNILKHHEEGIYRLRLVNGEWCMQNKQKLPYSPDILECIISKSDSI